MKILRKMAGWWKIENVDTGQVDWDQPEKEGLINAIPGEDAPEELYNGDGPADTMGAAIDNIAGQYRDEWDREPKPDEIEAIFNFCFNGWKRRQKKDLKR